MAYMWAYDYPFQLIGHELNVGVERLVDWGNFFRDLAVEWNKLPRDRLGGIDEEDFLGMVVEIDETAFGKRKYNRGRLAKTRWVFGGVERGTGRMFAKVVCDRDAATLLPLIEENIEWGSHIISDGWAAYNGIRSDVYSHSVVVHVDNFVSPIDDAVHTQNIESLWNKVKSKLKRQRGTSDALFDSYIDEQVWRSYRSCQCKFVYLLLEIIRQYPL
jgi:IS1 family transposase